MKPLRHTCEICHYRMNGMESMVGPNSEPQSGQVALCGKCGFVGVFVENDDHYSIAAATEADLRDFREHAPDLYAKMMNAQKMIRARC